MGYTSTKAARFAELAAKQDTPIKRDAFLREAAKIEARELAAQDAPPGAAPTEKTGAAIERVRAILALEATHAAELKAFLAYETQTTPEQAKQILSLAARGSFFRAMGALGNPRVGVDGSEAYAPGVASASEVFSWREKCRAQVNGAKPNIKGPAAAVDQG